jgi:hypothetical protein
MPWYDGPTLVEALEQCFIPSLHYNRSIFATTTHHQSLLPIMTIVRCYNNVQHYNIKKDTAPAVTIVARLHDHVDRRCIHVGLPISFERMEEKDSKKSTKSSSADDAAKRTPMNISATIDHIYDTDCRTVTVADINGITTNTSGNDGDDTDIVELTHLTFVCNAIRQATELESFKIIRHRLIP